MPLLGWGTAARMALDGLAFDEVQAVADRWCGTVDLSGVDGNGELLRLVVPEIRGEYAESEIGPIRIGVRGGDGPAPLELKVGPHVVAVGVDGGPDAVRFSRRRTPSRFEVELLIDLGVNHLLARQGLPVLHSCAFELGGIVGSRVGRELRGKDDGVGGGHEGWGAGGLG